MMYHTLKIRIMKYSNYKIHFRIYNLKFVVLISVLLLYASCSENALEEKPLGFLTPSNAYSTPAGAKQGIIGLHTYARNFYTNDDKSTVMLTTLGTDEAYYGEDPAGGIMSNYITSIIPTDSNVKLFWTNFYSLVQKANVLIEAVNASETSSWDSEAQKKAILAEAMFFRAFAYRGLVTLWGDVPIVKEAFDYAKTDFKRDTKADVYAFIEEDLKYATANLPVPGKEETPGRITQGAAWHLLSEVYLADSKYQLAVEAATHVINDYGYALMTKRFGSKLGKDIFGSGDVYFDLFQKENHNLTENTEKIWVIQVDPYITGGGSFNGERWYGPAYFRMGNTPDGKVAFRGNLYNGTYTGYSDTLGRPVAWDRPTTYAAYKIWRSDWKKDIRNAKHNIKRDFYFDNPASIYNGKKIDWKLYSKGARSNPMADTCQYLFPYFMKVASPCDHYTDPARAGGGSTHKDVYAFRLAETYLLRAEAYLDLNQKDKAAADINVVRNRAQATPVLPEQVNIDYILDERARELYSEEWRLITLMRLNLLVSRVRKYNDNPITPGLNIQDYNNLWPIPQTQIDLNIGADFPQNQGYN
jgi:hypothetical protein